MLQQTLADLVFLTHLAFILFVILGGLLVLRWRLVAWAHLPAVAWGAGIEFFGWVCPLTQLEASLRSASGGAGYSGGFIERYLVPVIYPAELSRELQFMLGCALVVFNVIVYLLVWRRAGRRSEALR